MGGTIEACASDPAGRRGDSLTCGGGAGVEDLVRGWALSVGVRRTPRDLNAGLIGFQVGIHRGTDGEIQWISRGPTLRRRRLLRDPLVVVVACPDREGRLHIGRPRHRDTRLTGAHNFRPRRPLDQIRRDRGEVGSRHRLPRQRDLLVHRIAGLESLHLGRRLIGGDRDRRRSELAAAGLVTGLHAEVIRLRVLQGLRGDVRGLALPRRTVDIVGDDVLLDPRPVVLRLRPRQGFGMILGDLPGAGSARRIRLAVDRDRQADLGLPVEVGRVGRIADGEGVLERAGERRARSHRPGHGLRDR